MPGVPTDKLAHLRGAITDEEAQLAATIGADASRDLNSKIRQLFADLRDPLLSPTDVRALLGSKGKKATIDQELDALVDEGALEKSALTQRPLDKPNTVLYRSAVLSVERLRTSCD